MQPLVRALTAMRALARADGGLTLQDLSNAIAAPIASVHRLLPTLEEEGFVVRSPSNRRYFIGPAAATVGLGAARRHSLIGSAYEPLQELARAAGHPVVVAERYADRAICTLRLEPTGFRAPGVSTAAQVGGKLPWHASSCARTLLADLDEQVVWRLLSTWEFVRYTARTPASVEKVWAHLEETRRHGYGIGYDEWEAGIWTLSTPVRDGAQRLVATISVAGHATEVGDAGARARIRDLTLETAAVIAADLGNSGVLCSAWPDGTRTWQPTDVKEEDHADTA
ncbi:IclR family transcriptional regulator [Nonomuraea sp. NPDC050691]|uniref:IclR family transcriptional regulator n=1 Tax=Nonomuraea sp. NPDC050691 TaxID=3155661 RepID=UPI0033C4A377